MYNELKVVKNNKKCNKFNTVSGGNMLDKVLIINTGGTIGMVHSEEGNPLSPLRPAENWHEIAKEHPILQRFSTDYFQFDPLIDSSDMHPQSWVRIAEVISENYDKYRGFVVLHGTDTMAYTSSALSFMLKNLNKPVVLTGSQVPLQKSRSDALQNLVTAIQVAGNDLYGARTVPEVCIFFRDTLLRGNRVRKMDATNYFGFSSPNYPSLGEAGGDLRIRKNRILPPAEGEFYIDTDLDERVIIIEIFPGLKTQYLKNIFESNADIKGVILKTYGNGNAPTNDEFIELMEYLGAKGIVVVNITQCTTGTVKMGLYEASARLLDAGVVSGLDLTPEAAIAKLMHLLGKVQDVELIKKLMQIDICGEQTLNHYDFEYNHEGSESQCSFVFDIPEAVAGDDLVEAAIRIKGITPVTGEVSDVKISIELEGNIPVENLRNFRSHKEISKHRDNMGDDILLSFNHCTKKLIDNCEKVKVTLKSDTEIRWGDIIFSIYSEN